MDFLRFKIGNFDCAVIRDFDFEYLSQGFVADIPLEEVNNALRKYHSRPGVMPSPYIALWVNTGQYQVLIDTGCGYSDQPHSFQGKDHFFKGTLPKVMIKEGLAPEAIDLVVLTHFHPDHIGGIFDDQGQPNFPNAKFVYFQEEWDFWFSGEATKLPPIFHHFIDHQIEPLKTWPTMGLESGSRDIVPGVEALFTPGHTPGHMAVSVRSEGEELVYISDVVLHPMFLDNPHWQTPLDYDNEQAHQSKTQLLDKAARKNQLLCAFHFPFPCLGYVRAQNDHWVWEPVKPESLAGDPFS